MATSVVSAGMLDGASPQLNAHTQIPARWRETDKRGEKEKDGMRGGSAVIHGSSFPTKAAIDVASAGHSRVRVTGGWKWLQIQPDRQASRQPPMTACNSHAKKCRQAV